VNGNTLTVVSTVAGIVVGFMTSWWFTRSGKRDAQKKQLGLLNEISALKSLLSSVAESVTESITSNVEALQSAQLPDRKPTTVTTSPSPTSTLDVLVRASLGALLDEHGEVSFPRLFKAVSQDLPGASLSSVLSSLEELRKSGKVSWPGDDVRKAGVIKVHPQ
jgi:hypothetical protein